MEVPVRDLRDDAGRHVHRPDVHTAPDVAESFGAIPVFPEERVVGIPQALRSEDEAPAIG
jgi:hypothetical protein